MRVDDDPAYAATRELFRREGLIVGPSTGAIVEAVRRLELDDDELVVGISPDSGLKYLSFFAELLGDEGNPEF